MDQNVRILLVEDEESLQDAIKMNLQMENYHVVVAADGISALREFRNSRFDLIILDVMLPEIDGFTVCRTIRLENKKIPILMLTAKDTTADKVEGLRLGADDYLTKPLSFIHHTNPFSHYFFTGFNASIINPGWKMSFKFYIPYFRLRKKILFIDHFTQNITNLYSFHLETKHRNLEFSIIRIGKDTDSEVTTLFIICRSI